LAHCSNGRLGQIQIILSWNDDSRELAEAVAM
jgi:hypothetical protein